GLEDFLGLKLFDRSSGRLEPTDAGRRYLARIEPALREIEAATAALKPEDGRAAVRLTLPPSLAVTWLIPRLGRLEAAHPEIDLQIVATTRTLDLARDRIDAAIRYGSGPWPKVDATFLFDDLATPVAAPGLIASGADPAEALAKVRLIVNRAIPGEWPEWTRARGFEPPPLDDALALDTVEQTLSAAEAGHGVAMGRSPYIEPRVASGVLATPFGAAGPTGAAYHLCRPAGAAPTAPARRLMRWLEAEAQDYAGGVA
ncbi:MAG: LysR substrate-binding domain-containing protein, partial [Pseudomonadota bacterium]